MVLILAARSDEPGARAELVGELAADSAATLIRPHELSPDAVAELVRGTISAGAAAEFCLACHGASGGNPFLLHELLGELVAAENRGSAEEAAAVRELAPATIQRAVLLRMARLPDAASDLARAVAVLGDDADLRDAAELAELEEQPAGEAADALARAGILESRRPLRFTHPLIRTAVYADMGGTAKSARHRAAAELLSQRGAEPERIAVHLLGTDPAGDAAVAETLALAAEHALDRGAPETAVTYLRRALAEPPPSEVRLELVSLHVRACFRAGDRGGFDELRAKGTFEALISDSARLLESAAEIAQILYHWDLIDEVEPLLERATRVAVDAGEDDLVVRMQALLAFWTHQSPLAARAHLDRFKDRIQPDTPGMRLYLAVHAFFAATTGAPRNTIVELALGAVADGRIWRDGLDDVAPLMPLAVLRWTDELDAAERAHAELLAVTASRGAWALNSEGYDRAELAFLRGQVADAEPNARLSVEASRRGAFARRATAWIALLVDVLVERDDLPGAEAELAASGLAAALPEDWWFMPLLFSRARLRLAEGKPRETLEDLQTMSRLASKLKLQGTSYIPYFSCLALAQDALGDHERARRVAEQEVAAARDWGLPRRTGIALRAQGLIEGGERGLELLRESIEVLADSPAKLEHARSLAEYGAMQRRAGRRADAREPLRAALEWARGTGALAVARRAHQELEATGEKLRPLAAEGIESLTPSERRVVDLAADGRTNREIAQALFLSVKTVEMHLSRAYRKLDIESRAELDGVLAR